MVICFKPCDVSTSYSFDMSPNARSIFASQGKCKHEELFLLSSCENFDVICVSESWLDSTIDNDCISLYGCLKPFRPDSNSHGGEDMAYEKSGSGILCT